MFVTRPSVSATLPVAFPASPWVCESWVVPSKRTSVRTSRGASWGATRGSTHLHLSTAADGQVADASASVQLEFDIGIASVGPQLMLTMAADTHDSLGGSRDGAAQGPPHDGRAARVGEVMRQVIEFHEAFDLPRQALPDAHVGDVLAHLRVRLLREETEEFAEGTNERDLVPIADALADVVYVAYGSALTYGIDLDAVIREVHRSNMSKLDDGGNPILRQDGKVLKSARYTPPAVANVLEEQLPLFVADTCAESGTLTS